MQSWAKLVPKQLRTLCFDIENKPGTYGGGDYVFPKVTAVAAQFLDEQQAHVWSFDRRRMDKMRKALREFRVMWDEADAVMGHNIKRHDVKILNGLCTALDEPHLAQKRMIDTYLDQPKMAGISRSLENLAARWECPIQKLSMSEYDWERAYDGIPEGVAKMERRAKSDVQINIWLYYELLSRDLFKR